MTLAVEFWNELLQMSIQEFMETRARAVQAISDRGSQLKVA